MREQEYVAELKKMLIEDLNTDCDISPNLMKVKILDAEYPELSKDFVNQARSTAS